MKVKDSSWIFIGIMVVQLAVLGAWANYQIFRQIGGKVLGSQKNQQAFSLADLLRPRRHPKPTPTPGPTVTPTPAPSPTPAPVSGGGLPFGPFYPDESSYGNPFSGGFVDLSKMSVDSAKSFLETAKAKNMRLIVTIAGSRNDFQNADKSFSVSKHLDELKRFSSLDLNSYVRSGTVIGELLLDEPQDPSNWNGQPVSFSDIEAAAANSKSLWSSLPTGVGSNPDWLAGNSSGWRNLDFVLAPFTAKRLCSYRQGNDCAQSISSWDSSVVSSAKNIGLKLALSINVLDGGDLSGAEVSAAQLTEWGTTIVNESYACAFTMWKNDRSGYFGQADIAAVVKALADVAKTKSPSSCGR